MFRKNNKSLGHFSRFGVAQIVPVDEAKIQQSQQPQQMNERPSVFKSISQIQVSQPEKRKKKYQRE